MFCLFNIILWIMLGLKLTLAPIPLQAYQPVQSYILYAAVLNLPGRIVNFVATLVDNSLVVVAEVIL